MTNSANDAGLYRLGTVVSLAGGLGALDAFPKPILDAGGQDNEPNPAQHELHYDRPGEHVVPHEPCDQSDEAEGHDPAYGVATPPRWNRVLGVVAWIIAHLSGRTPPGRLCR